MVLVLKPELEARYLPKVSKSSLFTEPSSLFGINNRPIGVTWLLENDRENMICGLHPSGFGTRPSGQTKEKISGGPGLNQNIKTCFQMLSIQLDSGFPWKDPESESESDELYHSTDSDSESGEPIPPNTGASAPAETGAPNAGASNTGASAPGPTLENINPPDVPTALSVAPSKPAEHAPAQVIEAPAPAPTSISQSLQPASVVAKTGEHGNFGCVVFSIFDYLPCFPGYRLARFLLGFWFINAGCSHQTCRHCCRDGWCCKHSTGYSLEGDRESPRATENAPGPWNLGLFFRPLKLKPWKIIEP